MRTQTFPVNQVQNGSRVQIGTVDEKQFDSLEEAAESFTVVDDEGSVQVNGTQRLLNMINSQIASAAVAAERNRLTGGAGGLHTRDLTKLVKANSEAKAKYDALLAELGILPGS